MQSPIVVMFRALVMLISLVAVPAIALFWNQIPDAVDRLWLAIEQHRGGAVAQNDPLDPAWASSPPATDVPSPLQEAPRYEPTGSAPQAIEPPSVATPASLGAQPTAPAAAPVSRGAPRGVAGSGPGVRPAAFGQSPAVTSAVRPAAYNEPVVRGQAPGSIEEPMPAPVDQFTAMQYRLRELGATYYLLENWGSDGSLYRFHCKMAIAGNSRYTRHFEATDRTPLQAIGRVLRDVEAWRAGRTP